MFLIHQDALNGDHVKVAIMLRAHGGTLGPKGDPELLEKLNHPNLPSVYDVKKVVNSLMRAQVRARAGIAGAHRGLVSPWLLSCKSRICRCRVATRFETCL